MVCTLGFYTTLVGVANLATRWHEVPLASPGGKLDFLSTGASEPVDKKD